MGITGPLWRKFTVRRCIFWWRVMFSYDFNGTLPLECSSLYSKSTYTLWSFITHLRYPATTLHFHSTLCGWDSPRRIPLQNQYHDPNHQKIELVSNGSNSRCGVYFKPQFLGTVFSGWQFDNIVCSPWPERVTAHNAYLNGNHSINVLGWLLKWLRL